MNRQALGLIETYGYVPAIEAADASLKAANVNLVKCEFVKGGLVTILITGDVSAVKASIDAGEAAANRIGKVISTTVIARTGEGLKETFYENKEEKKNKEEKIEKVENNKEVQEEKEEMKLSPDDEKNSKKKL